MQSPSRAVEGATFDHAIAIINDSGVRPSLTEAALVRLLDLYSSDARASPPIGVLLAGTMRAMHRHSIHRRVQIVACRLIKSLCDARKPNVEVSREEALDSGVLRALATTLRHHASEATVLEAAAWATLQLTYGSTKAALKAHASGLTELLRVGAIAMRAKRKYDSWAVLAVTYRWLALHGEYAAADSESEPELWAGSTPEEQRAREDVLQRLPTFRGFEPTSAQPYGTASRQSAGWWSAALTAFLGSILRPIFGPSCT